MPEPLHPLEAAARELQTLASEDRLDTLGAQPYDELDATQKADRRESVARIIVAYRDAGGDAPDPLALDTLGPLYDEPIALQRMRRFVADA